MRHAILLAALLLLAACGDEPPRAEGPAEGEVSAFLLEHPRAEAGLKHDIPLREVLKGVATANPRDAIPALKDPRHQYVSEATWLEDGDRVLVVGSGADARAYPLFILDGHELVNDVVAGRPVLATWCPLCGTAMAFSREVAGRVRTFGVSGYLWRSDVLLYDRESETFWSQIAGRAVIGPLTGTRLETVPSQVMSWDAFRARHPEGRVLSIGVTEGFEPVTYRRNRPYDAYRSGPQLFPGVVATDDRVAPKEEVVGVVVGGNAHAWTLAHVRATVRRGPGDAVPWFAAEVGGARVAVTFDAAADLVEVRTAEGRVLPALRAYWFAWALFHPETGVTGGKAAPGR